LIFELFVSFIIFIKESGYPLHLKLTIINDSLDFKIKVDGLDPSIKLNGCIQSNLLTNFFTYKWIEWI
jgi:hypothetical protein